MGNKKVAKVTTCISIINMFVVPNLNQQKFADCQNNIKNVFNIDI